MMCYIRLADPQPPATDPVWQGHRPGDGVIYLCYQPQTDIDLPFWSGNPPEGAEEGPSPVDVAELVIERMQLKAIEVGIVPEPGPDRLGIVGMPVYMWVEQPGPTTFGPITESATAGGLTVTATAEVERIEWEMGDGTTVTCTTDGTVYRDSFGRQPSPDCGHMYTQTSADQPGGSYTVTARSYWRIDWQGAGQSGTIRLDPLEQSVQIRVGEVQVLTQ